MFELSLASTCLFLFLYEQWKQHCAQFAVSVAKLFTIVQEMTASKIMKKEYLGKVCEGRIFFRGGGLGIKQIRVIRLNRKL